MKIAEKLEQANRRADYLNEALLCAAENRVEWLDPKKLSTIDGMPPRTLRVGLIEKTAEQSPLVILHSVDEARIRVFTPFEASQWSWRMVDELPPLGSFLKMHALEWPVYVHLPSFAWIRREKS